MASEKDIQNQDKLNKSLGITKSEQEAIKSLISAYQDTLDEVIEKTDKRLKLEKDLSKQLNISGEEIDNIVTASEEQRESLK